MTQHQLAKQIRTGQHIPDILDCLAQLSNDEVPTPPKVARAMLDILPDEVWGKPNYVWLDPCSKSGIFLREAAARLLEGLSDQFRDFGKRREHIYKRMLWGNSITEMTEIISRRSLYYSRDASGPASVVKFATAEGNLPFVRAEHTFPKKKDGTITGGCTICGAPLDLERGEGRENYAYSFIHGAYPTGEMKDMQFDVIVGNPPYQLGSTGGDSGGGFAMPVFQFFVEQAFRLNPKYTVMITPSRWFTSGRNMEEFRARMLADTRLRTLVDFPNAAECFPGNEIKGGVSYWLWDRDHSGPCAVTTIRDGAPVDGTVERLLSEHDIFVRSNTGARVVDKVWTVEKNRGALSAQVSAIQPFSLRTTFKGSDSRKGIKKPVAVYQNGGVAFMPRADVPRNDHWVDQWKVLTSQAYGAGEQIPHQIIGKPIIAEPGSVCTETYLVLGRFNTEVEAQRFARFISTRFVRFLVSLRKNTQHLYSDRFAFVPNLPMTRVWTDRALYKRYGITDEEVRYIESHVREMPDTEVATGDDE